MCFSYVFLGLLSSFWIAPSSIFNGLIANYKAWPFHVFSITTYVFKICNWIYCNSIADYFSGKSCWRGSVWVAKKIKRLWLYWNNNKRSLIFFKFSKVFRLPLQHKLPEKSHMIQLQNFESMCIESRISKTYVIEKTWKRHDYLCYQPYCNSLLILLTDNCSFVVILLNLVSEVCWVFFTSLLYA